MNFKNTIQENLLFLRKQKNLSTERVANILNLSRQAYSSYENGTRDISAESLKILANFYGTTLDLITSSLLIDARQPSISFTTIKYEDGGYSFEDFPTTVTNLNSNFIVVKIRDNITKVFETNVTHVDNHELLFEYKHKLYIAKIHYFPNGDGVIIENEIPLHFTKQQSKSIVFIGMLLATINKEYEHNDFF